MVKYRRDHKDEIRTRAQVLREEKRQIVLKEKERPCTDCGLPFPPVAMDFDHVRGKKVESICVMVDRPYSKEALVEEIKKCELVCACCHRVRTETRRVQSSSF